jgi:hypothetical protein
MRFDPQKSFFCPFMKISLPRLSVRPMKIIYDIYLVVSCFHGGLSCFLQDKIVFCAKPSSMAHHCALIDGDILRLENDNFLSRYSISPFSVKSRI